MTTFRWRRWLAAAALATVAAMAVATYGDAWRLPDRHNPWAPLAVAEPPGWLTRHKLRRLDDARGDCLRTLEQTPFRFEPVPDRQTGEACGFTNAVRIRRTHVAVGPAFVLSCRAAVSLALWERHVLLPTAERRLGAPVVRLEHFGSYACRNVYGRSGGRRSQHATADALDVAGVALADGRRVTVARDWQHDDPDAAPPARFLRDVHEGACGVFDTVLGPAYNAAHADHLHLDRGRFRICR